MSELLTTRAAARLLGVGTTSIKRWADAGVLECVKTPGGHRRFRRTAVEAMRGLEPAEVDRSDVLVAALLDDAGSSAEVSRFLDEERRVLGAWWRVCERIGPCLEDIGERWRKGTLTVMQEHMASERLHRALARCSEQVALPSDAPHALLLSAEGDEHTLGLSMVELCLREAGWSPRWAGRATPYASVRQFVARGECKMVAVSASSFSSDRAILGEQADRLGELCARHRVHLLLGGSGKWPDEPGHGRRIHTFAELDDAVAELERGLPVASEEP